MDFRDKRILFGEIIQGYSTFEYKNTNLFLYHQNYLHVAEFDSLYQSFYNDIIKQGVPTEEQRLQEIIRLQRWGNKDEEIISNAEQMLAGLRKSKQSLYLQSQIEIVDRRIEREEAILIAKKTQKYKLLGTTAESITKKQVDGEYLKRSLYADNKFTNKFFEDSTDLDSLEEKEYNILLGQYSDILTKFSTKNIQYIAITPFLQNLYGLCDGKAWQFYGKPIVDLTLYQEQLLRWASDFKYILEHSKPPENILEKPEELISWYTSGQNLNKLVEKSENKQNFNVVGATAKDQNKNPAVASGIKIMDRVLDSGKKSFTMEDILKAKNA